ncbi:DUF5714 domain-containing protein [Anaeromyxobacter oryzae]|uniref:DUF5714 domain-containing protein n=1 Tax=Anaeromyxobacter oryzae TaxID=2918170 RepID=A0ABN6MPM1_9BACT|nr:DUF5714 domain-containing protein [Anaeromyxobacter oryzae]BDG02245.1 hypothetical protein AMOR_12410 [Anaeromyxobacter oryzae]
MSLLAPEHRSGCLVCGAALEYLAAAEPMACVGCGAPALSTARCRAGHFVCDTCHSASAKDVIERACAGTASTDPLAISRELMRHPKLKMHGPEHHLLVPAAFLAALANARGEPGEKPRLVAEARRRSDPVAGGFCGFQGACGAAIGAGIAVSLATGATPLSTQPWRLANAATARALDVVSRVGGPRCCKRDTWLVLLALVRFAREHLGVALGGRGEPCTFGGLNAECLADRCPFHPRPAR